jgi:hypothetical protein
MTSIYDLHDKAFARVSAFVVARNGEKVATVALKFPTDGAGRLYAYVHWLGLEMVRGHAGGYGYDKRTAAVLAAANRIPLGAAFARAQQVGLQYAEGRPWYDLFPAFREALIDDSTGEYWPRKLEKAGFTVLQAI